MCLTLWMSLRSCARSLLKRLLSIDPRSRPSAIELLAHPYFSTPHAHMLHKDRYLIRRSGSPFSQYLRRASLIVTDLGLFLVMQR